jgi:hypothetical protein
MMPVSLVSVAGRLPSRSHLCFHDHQPQNTDLCDKNEASF